MLDLVTLNKNNQPTTTSKILADRFHKVHRDVVRAINNLDIPEEFRVRNFAQSKFKADNINGLEYDCYEMTRDGFTLLAMGFTGKKAMEWKVKFIEAFNAMEAKLKELSAVSAQVDMKAIGGAVKRCTMVAVREELAKLFTPYEGDDRYYNIGDWDMVQYLQRWYWTRHKAILKELEEKDGRILLLESKLRKVEKALA